MSSTPNYTENYTTNQLGLPLDLGIILSPKSEVHTYLELTKGIDFSKYFGTSSSLGRIPKNRVKKMNAILFDYMIGFRSTRAIEQACQNDIRFMYLIEGMAAPSNTLINNVMNKIKDKLDFLLLEINKEIMDQEDIDTDRLYIDGTKIEADANKYTFKWKKSILKHRDKLYLKITNRLVGLIDYLGIELVYGKGKRKTQYSNCMTISKNTPRNSRTTIKTLQL